MEKLNLILDLQEEGMSRNEIKDKLGYKRLDSMTKYMRNRGYKVVNDKYVLDDSCNINVIVDHVTLENVSDDLKANIIDIARNYNDLKEMITWFKNRNDDKCITNVIEINNGIEINLPKAPIKRTTVRINEVVWNKFQALAESNPQYDKHDLLSQAILLFVEKYNKS